MNEQNIRRIVEDTVAAVSGNMTLARAEELCDAVLEEASRMGVRAVVCVSDNAGNPKIVKVADDAYIASYDVALNKAFTVVALKMSTSKLSILAQPGGELYGIQFTNGGRIVIFGGGDPLADKNGRIVGGLGVSGGTGEEDHALCLHGLSVFETL